MENAELQVENGQYTRIVNKVLDELVKVPLLGAEYAVCLFVIRKTYGYQKKDDEISITQFEEATGNSRPTIVKALKNLQLVNILTLVKKGNSKNVSNRWAFNKYYSSWKLVKTPQLVKSRDTTSKVNALQLVKTPKHTKETKENTKERIQEPQAALIVELIHSFEGINPSTGVLYGSPPQRRAAGRLIEIHGLERTQKAVVYIKANRDDRFCPSITTPVQLEAKWAQLEDHARKSKKKTSRLIT